MCFSWKAKAVISFWIFSFFLLENSSWAQSARSYSPDRKITIAFHNVSCEDVLQRLSKESNVSFVYSSSVLDLQKSITFSVHHQTLDEILKLIAHQMNVSFKVEGDHIVVKKSTEAQRPVKVKIETKAVNEFLSPRLNEDRLNLILASLSSQTLAGPSQKSVSDLRPEVFQRDSSISGKTAKLIAKIQRQLLLSNSNASIKNNVNPKWFTAASVIFNDYSQGGIEIQGGHQRYYVVLNAAHLDNNRYRVGYGAGTSLPLANKLSLQLIFTTARVTNEKDFAILKNSVKLTSWHSQLKFQGRYALSQNISLRGGITFNLLNTRYKFLGYDIPADIPLYFRTTDPMHRESRLSALSDVLTSSSTISAPYTFSNSYSQNNYLNTKTWIGFEIGISYQINFFRRR